MAMGRVHGARQHEPRRDPVRSRTLSNVMRIDPTATLDYMTLAEKSKALFRRALNAPLYGRRGLLF